MLKEIQQKLKALSTPEALEASRKFLPGYSKVYGVRMPLIDGLVKDYKAGGFELAKQLWKAGALEEKIMAAKILQKIAKKDAEQSLKLVKHLASGIDNWAVCDALGMQSLQGIRDLYKEEIFKLAKKYNKSTNLWERRLSLVLVEYYTRFKDCHPAIMELVKPLETDEEYYVKKAVVWIKKNLKKGK